MKMLKKLLLSFGLCSTLLVSGCNDDSKTTAETAPVEKTLQPIIIQGALPIETESLAAKLSNTTTETIGGWQFWKGTYQGYPVIVSKTRMGMSNSAAATAIAITHYNPIAIINQGTSGGHDPKLNVYDIVVGKYTTNINAFRTPKLEIGEGSNSLNWNEAFDVLPEDEYDPEPIAMRKFEGDADLIAATQRAVYAKGQVVEGTLGSADVWNNELDRIAFFHQNYGTSAEEMEGASVAQIASQFNVPFVGIRVLSNNITNNGAYDPGTGEACQEFVLNVVVEYMQQKQAELNQQK